MVVGDNGTRSALNSKYTNDRCRFNRRRRMLWSTVSSAVVDHAMRKKRHFFRNGAIHDLPQGHIQAVRLCLSTSLSFCFSAAVVDASLSFSSQSLTSRPQRQSSASYPNHPLFGLLLLIFHPGA